MDVLFVDKNGRRRRLDDDLVEELLGDGCNSELDISDEEAESPVNVRQLLDEDIPEPEVPNDSDDDPCFNVPLAEICRQNQDIIPVDNQNNPETRAGHLQKKRPRLWKATTFNNVSHEFPLRPQASTIKTPMQYLNEYYNEDYFLNLANCTNLYYLRKTGNILNTNSQEMRRLFGMFLVMGCIPYPRIHMYWRTGMRLEVIADQMPRDRFFLLRNNMHIVDSDEPPTGNTNPLWKVQPALDTVKKACKAIERIPGNYSIDEQIIPFTGRCKLRVVVKNKPRPTGLKNYVITTSDGLMLDFEIYYSKNPAFTDKSLGEGPAVVLRLAQSIPPNSCLYFDRYFTTVSLLDRLREMQLHGTGTIMLNRIPDHKKLNLKEDKDMQRGDVIQFTSNGVTVVKWKDSKGVLMASNCTGGDNTSLVNRWDKKQQIYSQVTAPSVVMNYNKNMGGVDVLDQLLEYYRTFQKTKKWPVKVMVHFLDLAVANAWRQYKIDCESRKAKAKDLLWFRIDLADALMNSINATYVDAAEEEQPASPSERPLKRFKPAVAPSFEKRFDQFGHFPVFDNLSRGRKCRLENCSSSTKIRCQKCNVYLCILRNQNCFETFHCKGILSLFCF